MTGPGGGIVFFIDYYDQYLSFCAPNDCNYLEAAPQGWGNQMAVKNTISVGETAGSATVDPLMKWCSDTATLLDLNAWSNSAVGAGRTNTAYMLGGTRCTTGAAVAANAYSTAQAAAGSWWLPSMGELMLMYTNLRQAGVGGFVAENYWSSSEDSPTVAWGQYFNNGYQNGSDKIIANYVRPVRRF
jgi:hypothetical protein